ncbi:hypothetical protein WH47_07848 [Habropoda laboriosa]|uniref:Uncharacterized protein n=1 Tax=Habropoda laboriosa TaxID=597456 RepID=A0A0L7QPC9_9HYME|nr:hypothetical protein WH47_07848 [Habropoda laboriosa]
MSVHDGFSVVSGPPYTNIGYLLGKIGRELLAQWAKARPASLSGGKVIVTLRLTGTVPKGSSYLEELGARICEGFGIPKTEISEHLTDKSDTNITPEFQKDDNSRCSVPSTATQDRRDECVAEPHGISGTVLQCRDKAFDKGIPRGTEAGPRFPRLEGSRGLALGPVSHEPPKAMIARRLPHRIAALGPVSHGPPKAMIARRLPYLATTTLGVDGSVL